MVESFRGGAAHAALHHEGAPPPHICPARHAWLVGTALAYHPSVSAFHRQMPVGCHVVALGTVGAATLAPIPSYRPVARPHGTLARLGVIRCASHGTVASLARGSTPAKRSAPHINGLQPIVAQLNTPPVTH